jgi:hypothetical protein
MADMDARDAAMRLSPRAGAVSCAESLLRQLIWAPTRPSGLISRDHQRRASGINLRPSLNQRMPSADDNFTPAAQSSMGLVG